MAYIETTFCPEDLRMEKIGAMRVTQADLCSCFCRFAKTCLPPCLVEKDETLELVKQTLHAVKDVAEEVAGENHWGWAGPLIFLGVVVILAFAFKMWQTRCKPTREDIGQIFGLAGGLARCVVVRPRPRVEAEMERNEVRIQLNE
jgi:hypothetical protein